jgi:hypothetical protein
MSVYGGPADWWTNGTDAGRTHIATKGIVQSGLVLNLDAGASSSYPGSGTTWTDLSSAGLNGTLTNGPTFSSSGNGSINFDGVNDHIILNNPGTNFAFETGTYSVEFWANFNTAGPWYFIDGRNTSQTAIWALFVNVNRQIEWYNGSTTFFGSALAAGTSGWKHIVVSRTSTATNGTAIYLDSALYVTGTDNRNHSTLPTTSYLGMRFNTAEFITGQIAVARIYKNKALTAAEVLQNFNALRGRFGV